MEKESTPAMNPTMKARSSFSHVSTSDEPEEAGSKDCNDDTNIKEQVNLKLDIYLSNRTGRSRDLVEIGVARSVIKDSDITNMNKIKRNNTDHLSAEEIWALG
ncbi:hypothetical protein Ancab_005263 [Ancistrocladus abbreviatus]